MLCLCRVWRGVSEAWLFFRKLLDCSIFSLCSCLPSPELNASTLGLQVLCLSCGGGPPLPPPSDFQNCGFSSSHCLWGLIILLFLYHKIYAISSGSRYKCLCPFPIFTWRFPSLAGLIAPGIGGDWLVHTSGCPPGVCMQRGRNAACGDVSAWIPVWALAVRVCSTSY